VLLGVDEIKLCRDGDDRAFLTSRYDPDLISGCDFLHLDENHGGDRLASPSNVIIFICMVPLLLGYSIESIPDIKIITINYIYFG